jgi:transposase
MTVFRCPKCDHSRLWRLRRGKRKCKKCRTEFSPRGRPVAGVALNADGLHRVAHAFVVFGTIRRVASASGLSRATTQKICHLFRLAIAGEPRPVFEGPVEVDETYIGAQRKNQRLHIRKLYPPKRGHGTQKLPIIGAFDRATGTVRIEVMRRKLDKVQVLDFVTRSAHPGSRVFTDGFSYYRELTRLGFRHEWIDHNTGEYVRGDVHTNGIEGFWGCMKRRMGVTGGMRRARLFLFASEQAWRYNTRRFTDTQKADLLVDLLTTIGGTS